MDIVENKTTHNNELIDISNKPKEFPIFKMKGMYGEIENFIPNFCKILEDQTIEFIFIFFLINNFFHFL